MLRPPPHPPAPSEPVLSLPKGKGRGGALIAPLEDAVGAGNQTPPPHPPRPPTPPPSPPPAPPPPFAEGRPRGGGARFLRLKNEGARHPEPATSPSGPF